MDTIHMNVMDMQLPDDGDAFTQRFNYCGWLWRRIDEEGISEAEKEERYDEWAQAKLALEQGYPISFRADYNS